MKRSVWSGAWVVAVLPLAALSACISANDVAIGVDCASGFCDGGPTFTPPADDGGNAEAALPENVAMCPVLAPVGDVSVIQISLRHRSSARSRQLRHMRARLRERSRMVVCRRRMRIRLFPASDG